MSLDPLLISISALWAATNSVARKLLTARARRLPRPVISIGNIVAGGSGKTELAAAVARRLAGEGRRVVVASRGYRSAWEAGGGVAADFATAAAHRFPDESLVILKKAPGAAVAVGRDRFAVLSRHWEELHPDVVVLDDGYQHFSLARDLDILVHDFSVRWPVLREWPNALKRASVRVALSDVPAAWDREKARFPWVRARYVLVGGVDAAERQHRLPSAALVFCGLGNPARFRRSLTQAGVAVRGFRAFHDHAEYAERDVRELLAWQRQSGGHPLLTTLKDFVKLGPFIESQGGVAGFEPRWARIELEFLENEALLWDAVEGACGT